MPVKQYVEYRESQLEKSRDCAHWHGRSLCTDLCLWVADRHTAKPAKFFEESVIGGGYNENGPV